MSDFLKKINDYRIAAIAILGLAPQVAEALAGIELSNGLAVAISTGALAVAGLLTIVNNRPSK